MPFHRFGGGSAPVSNFSTKTEFFGRTGTAGAAITSGAVGVKGDWAALAAGGPSGALQNDITDLLIGFQGAGAASARFLFDLGVGDGTLGGTTVVIDNIWAIPSTTNIKLLAYPLNRYAGERLWLRCSSSGAGNTVQAYGRGLIRSTGMPPRYNNCAQVYPGGSASLTNTLPNTLDITMVTAAGAGFVQWTPELAAANALAFNMGMRSAAAQVTTNQNVLLRAAKGATPELFYEAAGLVQNAAPVFNGTIQPAFHDLTGQRLVLEVLAGTAGVNDIIAPQVWRLW